MIQRFSAPHCEPPKLCAVTHTAGDGLNNEPSVVTGRDYVKLGGTGKNFLRSLLNCNIRSLTFGLAGF